MNKKTIGIGLTLFALFAVGLAFGQTAQQASQFVNRLKSIASDFERLARDSRYNDAKTADLYESVQRKYNDWAAEYQRFLDAGGGGNFTSKQVDDINAAVQKVMNAVQTIETNVANGSQPRPSHWKMIVRCKYNQYESGTFTEEVTVYAASLDEAKEKAIREVQRLHDWAYIVDARVK